MPQKPTRQGAYDGEIVDNFWKWKVCGDGTGWWTPIPGPWKG